jgi:hypothetical protein
MLACIEDTSTIWSPVPIASLICREGSCSLYSCNNHLESALILGISGLKFSPWKIPNSQIKSSVFEEGTVNQLKQILTLSIPSSVRSILPSVEENWKARNGGAFWNDCLITGHQMTLQYQMSSRRVIS